MINDTKITRQMILQYEQNLLGLGRGLMKEGSGKDTLCTIFRGGPCNGAEHNMVQLRRSLWRVGMGTRHYALDSNWHTGVVAEGARQGDPRNKKNPQEA